SSSSPIFHYNSSLTKSLFSFTNHKTLLILFLLKPNSLLIVLLLKNNPLLIVLLLKNNSLLMASHSNDDDTLEERFETCFEDGLENFSRRVAEKKKKKGC
ncbi:unnamed protein product, partial [Arabidopsis halleri]